MPLISRAPESGQIVRVRQRQYLVEEVSRPPEPEEPTLARHACADDHCALPLARSVRNALHVEPGSQTGKCWPQRGNPRDLLGPPRDGTCMQFEHAFRGDRRRDLTAIITTSHGIRERGTLAPPCDWRLHSGIRWIANEKGQRMGVTATAERADDPRQQVAPEEELERR